MVFAIGLIFIAAVIGVELYTRYQRRQTVRAAPLVARSSYQMKADQIRLPGGLYFHPGHTWSYLAENGLIQTGVDDFLMHITGPPSRLTLPEKNTSIKQGEPFMQIHQNGHSLMLRSPVTGKVSSINESVQSDPSVLAKKPYGGNWICEIEVDNWRENTWGLLLGQRAGNWLHAEMQRLRDFFAEVVAARDPELPALTLQDGGEVAEQVLSYQDKDVWDAFQSDFLDAV